MLGFNIWPEYKIFEINCDTVVEKIKVKSYIKIQIPATTNQLLILMATADRKVRILTPSLQSMNKLLLELVEYQAKKSAIRFWDDLNRRGTSPTNFDQQWFSEWKVQEINKLNVDYVYGMFKRFVRSTMTTEGMSPSRTFPRLVTDHGATLLIPVEVTYPGWTDPALNFREMAQFTDGEIAGIWDGMDFTTSDLILQVCSRFDAFMEWFAAAVRVSLDKIRDSALIMSKLQTRFQWVEKLDVKVIEVLNVEFCLKSLKNQ